MNFPFLLGGMALWVNIGDKAQKIAEVARQQGIFILAEHAFHLDQKNDQDKYIRLGFAGQNEQQLKQGLLRLKSILIEYVCKR
ncbi:hypothetical protein L3081_17840 [Colwellia sp. MSW7]|uniref:Uncharacterized protein n=1 Tax=Colwellia maritima TaxID=2912588 RepID=A0ABS9X3Z1_9GAMM|nr:hypothetical protein [Colwellia maritima]MCI2284911.1 hypothetical protein [Colwellia maritima]